MPVDRRRVMRELTFWLRPAFVVRCLRRFNAVEGFDRAIALASSAFTALIPLSILVGALLPRFGSESTADRIIERFDLSGDGATAVRDAFAPPEGVQTSLGIVGALLLIVTVLSFTRAVQRLIERTWELPPLSVRNTRGGLWWIAGLVAYSAVSGAVAGFLNGPVFGIVGFVATVLLGIIFLVWSGVMLSARRVDWPALLPFGLLATALAGVYMGVSGLWLPQLFDSYTGRYGVIGATFALISWLFGFMLAIVVSSAIGREIHDELRRIRHGERESDAEVHADWRAFQRQVDAVREQVRRRVAAFRARHRGDGASGAGDGEPRDDDVRVEPSAQPDAPAGPDRPRPS